MATRRKQFHGRTKNSAGKARDVREPEYTKGKRTKLEPIHKYNDVSWYAHNEALLRDSASFSYNFPVGIDLPLNLYGQSSLTYETYAAAVPSLMSIEFVPTIGYSDDSTSPANLAAQNIYAYVRYMNSGAKNYDMADLMLYLLAMDSVYMTWNWLKRVYGYINTPTNQYNRTVPKVFTKGDGVAYEDWLNSLADVRGKLNAMAIRISSFCVPAVMPIFLRHSWLVSNIYKDSDNNKAQMYMFTPIIAYQYSETSSEFGGELTPVTLGTTNAFRTPSQLFQILTNMLDALAYSEDIGIMSGDILKAYGQEKLFKLAPIEENYTVEPVYNEEVLNQIHNLTIMDGYDMTSATARIVQDANSGYLIYKPNFTSTAKTQVSKAFVNMPWDNVTPANTMVGTRLTALRPHPNDQNWIFGSEFVTRIVIHYESKGSWYWTAARNSVLMIPTNGTNDTVKFIGLISQFDWHPIIYIILNNVAETNTPQFVARIGDVTNFTIIDRDPLRNMHMTALLSEFNVPQLGSF